MCLFPRKNLNRRNRHQLTEYECGNCPECLSKRSRLWALRATMEAKYNVGMMITLTYDQYERDANGRIIGEKPADTRELSKRDCQLFIKRLRKHYSDRKLRYILTAEHGTRTGRSHYHAVIFGVVFEDIVPYKKTKRGNQIYLSQTLKTLWGKGICTVDCVNISTAVARYCTKYCAKSSGVDDTFMLFSRGIGDRALEERLYRTERIQRATHTINIPHQKYIVEGSAYAIPRTVFKNYFERKRKMQGYARYVAMRPVKNCDERQADAYARYVDKSTHLAEVSARSLLYWEGVYNNAVSRVKLYKRPKTRVKYQHIAELKREKLLEKAETYRLQAEKLRKSYERECKHALAYTEDAQYTRYKRSLVRRAIYKNARDNDSVYKRYLQYWQNVNKVYNITRPAISERLQNLNNAKYWRYRQVARVAHNEARQGKPYVVPWSKCLSTYYPRFWRKISCLDTPNDTEDVPVFGEVEKKLVYFVPYRFTKWAKRLKNAKLLYILIKNLKNPVQMLDNGFFGVL